MPAPLSPPEDIARRMEAVMDTSVRTARPDADPVAIARAVRDPQGHFAAHIRTNSNAFYENHLHLRWIGDQLMIDTSEADYLIRHADIWGVYRRPATQAVGFAQFAGLPGTIIPAGFQLRTPAGPLVETIAASPAIDISGLITVYLRAVEGGALANTPGNTTMLSVSILAGLDPQSATLDAEGLQGGAEIEGDPSLLARVLAVIREPGHGGAAFDYPKWVQGSFAACKVKPIPSWVGPGSVGVVVVMGTAAAPRVPTGAELIAMADLLVNPVTGLRPVTAEVYVLPYTPLVVPLTIGLDPDSGPSRAAVEAAIAAFFAGDARVGTKLYRSRLIEAISAASGEYRHDLTVPAADITPARTELPVPGAITWVAAS